MQISHGALLRLVDEACMPLPVGSTATLRAASAAVPVGYEGNAYVQDLDLNKNLTLSGRTGGAAVSRSTIGPDRAIVLRSDRYLFGSRGHEARADLAALMVLAPATAQSACTVSASGVAFGVYNPLSATSTNATGTVTLSCNSSCGLGGYNIALSTAVAAAMPGKVEQW
jgi:hypothetical protein